jgi:hypothetical protein
MRLLSIITLGFFLALATLQVASSARATESDVVSRMKFEDLASVLTQAGLAAQVKTGTDGKAYLEFKMKSGSGVAIGTGCKTEGCAGFIIFVVFDATGLDPNWANDWNVNKLFVRAYTDAGGLYLEQDVMLLGGVTPAHVVEQFKYFNKLVSPLIGE